MLAALAPRECREPPDAEGAGSALHGLQSPGDARGEVREELAAPARRSPDAPDARGERVKRPCIHYIDCQTPSYSQYTMSNALILRKHLGAKRKVL